jgi:hypothetical protein
VAAVAVGFGRRLPAFLLGGRGTRFSPSPAPPESLAEVGPVYLLMALSLALGLGAPILLGHWLQAAAGLATGVGS